MSEGRHKFQVTEQIAAPRDAVFSFLTDHFLKLWPGKAEVLKQGSDEPNGLGYIRRMHLPGDTLEEEIVTHERPSLIEYKVINEAAISNHLGRLELTDSDGGTRLLYTISFDYKPAFVGPVVPHVLRATWAVKGHRVLRQAFPAS